MDEELEFEKDWLSVEKMEFKILTLITVLADNHLAYRGTLADMCAFCGVGARDSRNNARIRTAIENLKNKGLIKTIQDGRTWTLTLSRDAERRSKVIRIKRDWVSALHASKGRAVDWAVVLKVWLYLIDNHQEVLKSSEIAQCLGVSISTVSRARQVLIDMNAITADKVNLKDALGQIRCLGMTIVVNAWIDA